MDIFTKKGGFTLAEVLITLAIIGVVAALTIPTVVRNYQKQQTIVKLKKAWSIINQAYNNSQAENGMYQTWDRGIDIGAEEYFSRYWKPYLKVAKICTSHSDCGYESAAPWKDLNGISLGANVVDLKSRSAFYTQDGIFYVIYAYVGGGSESDEVYVDLNGSKKPNVRGRDLFMFFRTNKGILPYCYNSTYNNVNNSCSKTGGGGCCAAKIARDGWEIKDDYPW